MTGWLILAGYGVGTVVGARMALQMLMARVACGKGCDFLSICREYHAKGCAKPVGEIRPRGLGDGVRALILGLAWPVVIVIATLLHSTPPTEGETKRLMAEQADRIEDQRREIDRLTRGL